MYNNYMTDETNATKTGELPKLSEADVIRFQATTAKYTTLTDGTRRIYIDLLGDTPYEVDTSLIKTNQPGIILEVAIVAIKANDRKKRRITEKTKPNTEPTY